MKMAFVSTIPIFAGYIMLGIGFGILLSEKGYGPVWALFMSIFMFAGSMQYVGVDLLASGASLISSAVMTVLVNARHLFYGISMIDKYRGAGAKKFYMIFGLTDETYSLLCEAKVPDDVDRHTYSFFVTLFDHFYWITGCVLGAVIGTVVPFEFKGVEFVLTALFVSIFTEQWLSTNDHVPALIGAVSTAVCLVIFGSENFLIPSMLAIIASLSVLKFIRKDKKNDN
ncbi:MAG: branched-chain amino acid transporter AzlC [Ruminococcaceae bacterium]|nr:branched-chain amino acid transporter AzlC [Oscillospiraceae bacterium]